MKIYLGSDHAGFELKEGLKAYLQTSGHEVEDMGAHELDPSDSYVDFVAAAAKAVAGDPGSRGIVFGGSGQGEAIAANRVRGIRAFVYYAPGKALGGIDVSGAAGQDGMDIVRLSRLHNNSNVLSFGARFVTLEDAKAVTEVWLSTEFMGQHHQGRIEQLDRI